MKWHLKHEQYGDKPWAVQAEALKRSSGRPRFGFHLAQGLGKSALVFNEFVESDAEIMLVISPQSFKADWPLVPAEWGVPEVTSGMWPKNPMPTGEKTLYAVNYEAVRSGAGKQLLKLMEQRRVMLVPDETTSIINPQSQTSKAVIELSKRAYMVRVLNGTPLVKNCMDLYAPLRCLGELNGVNPFAFRNRFAILGGYMGKQITGIKNEQEFYELLDRVAFRALAEDWRKDLPGKMPPTTIHLEMTPRQRVLYQSMLEEFFVQIGDLDVSADMVLTQLSKLRQISSCLAMQDGQSGFFEEPSHNPKFKAMFDVLEGGSNKAIVVYYYKATGDTLMEVLQKAGYNPARIQGSVSSDEIKQEKSRFNTDPSCRVLVGQEAATARGHTLIAGTGVDRCTRMLFIENSYSLMERLQIEDRIHRGAQDQPCFYYDFVISPVEAAIAKALQKKKAMADAVDDVVKVARSELDRRR